jgi:hypothetical protein
MSGVCEYRSGVRGRVPGQRQFEDTDAAGALVVQASFHQAPEAAGNGQAPPDGRWL